MVIGMPFYSARQLSAITGMPSELIRNRLVNIAPRLQGNTEQWDTRDVLPVLYGQGEQLTTGDEKTRLAHHQANIAQLKEQEMRGSLIPKEEVVAYMSDMVKRARGKLLPIPGRLSNRVQDLAEIEDAASEEIMGALNELSRNTE
jgi:phage terminase Nu1 subunit (DNA packaging protein)